ncbi:G2E3 ligase, partial [Certhia familiaris]|nr:G2E3 ligase [Certhia familiaris]
QLCYVCGQSGATIMCHEEDCDRWFHLPCAKEGGCVTHYIPRYRYLLPTDSHPWRSIQHFSCLCPSLCPSSYCHQHRPEQDVQVTPEPGTQCLICMELVDDRKTFRTMVCPACKRAWFHRDCIQGQAMRTGILCLQCPLCRDMKEFLSQMFILGIRVPFR